MVILKSLILSAFIFFQIIQSFCIYNELTDGSIQVIQEHLDLLQPQKTFKKVIKPGLSECCHYTNKDCSRYRKNDTETTFYLAFIWANHQTDSYWLKCTTGGGLTIHGNEENQSAVCKDAFGVKTYFSLISGDKQRLF